MGSKEQLKELAQKGIEGIPTNFRCHEVARKIGISLKSVGVNVSIRDGTVIYDTYSLQNSFLSSFDFFQNLPENAKKELLSGEKARKRIKVLHSWCEVDGQEGDVIVIDWHASLRLSKSTILKNILLVDDKKRLPHVYNPLGVQVGNWIIFKAIPPLATKLRI